MAKLNRERRLIERRQEKQVRKDARKRAAAAEPEDSPSTMVDPPGALVTPHDG